MFTLGREVDIHYPTNQFILFLTAITAIIGFFIKGEIMTGIKIGGTIFLTWALSRELDPKREYGAFLSVIFSLYSLFISFNSSLLEVFFWLLILRMINTTGGKHPTLLDAGVVLALAGYLSFYSANPVYILLYLIGVFLSGLFKKNQAAQLILLFLAGGSIGYLVFMLFSQGVFTSPILSFTSLLILIVLYSAFAILDQGKTIQDDQENEINSMRILKAQLFFAPSAMILALLTNPAIGNMILYSASMAGLTLYGIISKVFRIED